jgi:hypothetical protein
VDANHRRFHLLFGVGSHVKHFLQEELVVLAGVDGVNVGGDFTIPENLV